MAVFVWTGQTTNAQDVQDAHMLEVDWQNEDGTVKVNALRDAIAADTTDSGERAHEVYKLKQGGFYWITDPIDNPDFHLIIEGDPGDPENDRGNPPVIQMVTREDGTAPSGRIFSGGSSITLKHVWVIGADDTGTQTYYQPMQIDGSGNRYVFDGVYFERSNFAIPAISGSDNDVIFRNCKFRNLIGKPSTQQWEGRGISVWSSQDTVIVENNTFFNVGMTSFQLEGGFAKYFRFNHNTIVNQGRHFLISNKKTAFMGNNLIINGFFHGEGHYDLTAPGRVTESTGLFPVDILPATFGLELERRVVLANTYHWRNPEFDTFYADSIQTQYFANDSTRYFFDNYEKMVAQDTVWMEDYPQGMSEDAFTGDIVDSMWTNINDLRQGQTPAQPYFYKLPEQPTAVSWPLPEDFSYTDSDLMTAGTDGLPIGDLNWFPDKKDEFYADQQANVNTLEDLAGEPESYEITNTIEAEGGTLSGDASVFTAEGTTYYSMTNAGYIEWNFELDQADSYTMEIVTRSQSNPRGEHVLLNGTGLRNDSGFGEFYFDGLTYPEWKTYTVTNDTLIEDVARALDLESGSHTVRIEPSWGYQDFQKVVMKYSDGEVAVELTAPMAETEIVSPGVESAPGEPVEDVPSGFQSVEVPADGSGEISFDLSDIADGDYLARIFYKAPSGDATGSVSIGGTMADEISFTGSESTTSTSSGLFTVVDGEVSNGTQAASTMTLAASGHVQIDYLQLAKRAVSIGDSESLERPNGFVLEQNYPNPFNPTTNINFSLGKSADVQLTVYNVLGQKVATLINNNFMNAGAHTVQFDARNLASGVYFYRLEAGNFTANKQMMLIK